MRPFLFRARTLLRREDVREWAVGLLGRDLSYAKYQIESQSKTRVVFVNTSRSVATWILTVILFPLGLIFFFAFKRTSNITVLMEKAGGGSEIVVSGNAKPRVIEGIEHRLRHDFEPLDEEPGGSDT
jgi:hypothetical protein